MLIVDCSLPSPIAHSQLFVRRPPSQPRQSVPQGGINRQPVIHLAARSSPSVPSVDATSWLPARALRMVCHARVAHLTRAGNSEIPEKTASFPSPELSLFAKSLPVTRSWKVSKRASASACVLPFNVSVRMDAEAVEIAQPDPRKLISLMRLPSSFR